MKIAVVLFNLGGPDKLDNVEPFHLNNNSTTVLLTSSSSCCSDSEKEKVLATF